MMSSLPRDEDCCNCVTECHKSLLCKLYGTPYGWYSLEQALLQQRTFVHFLGNNNNNDNKNKKGKIIVKEHGSCSVMFFYSF